MWFQPHMVAEGAHLMPARRGDVNLENIQKVISGMYGVVNEGGTGGRAKIPGIDVCGKTGTAQLISNDAIKAGFKRGENMKDNAWFVGFAPREAPEIVVAALFENGAEGPLAAPIVRDVMKAYFDKKARLAQPQPQIASLPTGLLQAPPRLPASSAAVNP
jgi:penicillin-binding protein 2